MAVTFVLVALILQVTSSLGRAPHAGAADNPSLTISDLTERMAIADSDEREQTSFNKVKRILKLLPYKPHKWANPDHASPEKRLHNNSTDIPIAIIVSSNLKSYVDKQTDINRNDQHSIEDTDGYQNRNANSYGNQQSDKINKHSRESEDSYQKKNTNSNIKNYIEQHSDKNRNRISSTEDTDGYRNKNTNTKTIVDKKSSKNLNEQHTSTEDLNSYRNKDTNRYLKANQHSDKGRNDQQDTNSFPNMKTNIDNADTHSGKSVTELHSTEDKESFTNKNRNSKKSYVEQHSDKTLIEHHSADTASEPDAIDMDVREVLEENDDKGNVKLGDDDTDIANINLLDVFLIGDNNLKKERKAFNEDDNIINKGTEINKNIKATDGIDKNDLERLTNTNRTEEESNKKARNQETRTKDEGYRDNIEDIIKRRYNKGPNETMLQRNNDDVKIKTEDLTKNSYTFIKEDDIKTLPARDPDTSSHGREFEDNTYEESVRDDTNKEGVDMIGDVQSESTDTLVREDVKMAASDKWNVVDPDTGTRKRQRCPLSHKRYNFSFVFNK